MQTTYILELKQPQESINYGNTQWYYKMVTLRSWKTILITVQNTKMNGFK